MSATQARAAGGSAWVDQPTASSYTSAAAYSYNSSGGDITITRWSTGRYAVHFSGLDISSGNAQVMAYGWGNEYCTVDSWSSSSVYVNCFAHGGTLTDTSFVVSFLDRPTLPNSSHRAASIWNSSLSGVADPDYRWNSRGMGNRVSRQGTGSYLVALGDLSSRFVRGIPLVTAYGTSVGKYCTASNAGSLCAQDCDQFVSVQCYDSDGSPVDAKFSLLYMPA